MFQPDERRQYPAISLSYTILYNQKLYSNLVLILNLIIVY